MSEHFLMRFFSILVPLLLIAAPAGPAMMLRAQAAPGAPDTTSYAWLIKASHDAVDRGEFDTNRDEQKALYKAAEQYARRAVAANPADAEGHFELARSLGRAALSMGARDRVKYAVDVRNEAMAALKIAPQHAGALHVMGEWNAEVMRLNGFTRKLAKNLLGGKVFGEASWANAQRYLEQAVALEPNRIVHRLDLAAVYADRGDKAKAREQYDWIARAPAVEANDAHYKEEASRRLRDLR
jgi:tetratricopeptide (TPR) repeat protein